MPISEFTNSGPPITEQDVSRLEQKLDVTLPPDYRAFLLRTNGGRPTPEDVFGEGTWESMMDMFFSVTHDDISETIAQAQFAFSDRIPDDLLPIGLDAGGSRVCIGIGPDNYGKVYFWSMDDEEDLHGQKPDYRNVWLLAGSFNEFVEDFRAYEDYDAY